MLRKLICFAFTIALLAAVCIPAFAIAGIIRVDIGGEGEVAIYAVGQAEDGGYRLSDSYGGGFLTFDDVLSDDLAAWLSQRASNGISQKTEQGIAVFEGLAEGLYLVIQTGERDGYHPFKPFLISLPWDGYVWDVDVSPQMELRQADQPQTGDGFALQFPVAGAVVSLMGLALCIKRKANGS